MAEKYVIDIEINDSGINKTSSSIDELNSSVKSLDTNVNEVSNTTSKAKGSISGMGNSFSSLGGPLKTATGGLQALGKQLWALVANPIVAIVAGIVLAFMGLYKILKSFQPVMDLIEQGMAGIQAIFQVLKSTVYALVTGATSLKEAFSGLGGRMKQAAVDAANLKKAMQELEDVSKNIEVTNAKLQTSINQLILQSKDRTKTEEERIALMNKAMELEQEQFENSKKLNDEAVRIAEESIRIKSKLTEEEILLLKEKGVEYANQLADQGRLNDEEIDALKNALLKREEINQQHIALAEKTQNRINQAADAAAEKEIKRQEAAEKAREKEAATAAKIAEQEQKIFQEKSDRIDKEIQDDIDKWEQMEKNAADANYSIAQNQIELDARVKLQKAETAQEIVAIEIDKLNKLKELDEERIDAAIVAAEKEFGVTSEIYKTLLLEKEQLNQEYVANVVDANAKIAEANAEANKVFLEEQKALFDEMTGILSSMGIGAVGEFTTMLKDFKDFSSMTTDEMIQSVGALVATGLQAVGQVLNLIAGEMEVNNKKSFEKQKKLRQAGAMMDAFAAAIAGMLAGLSVGGPWGIALGAITAAASLAFGIVQANKIGKMQYGGGSSSSGGGGGSVSMPALNASSSLQPNSNVTNPVSPTTQAQVTANNTEAPPVKAYVIPNEVTTGQAISRNVVANATF